MRPPDSGQDWLALGEDPLSVGAAYEWCVRGDCGAIVLFSGTVRDHAVDDHGALRRGVGHLTYEAYETQVVPRLADIAAELRVRWPATGRIVLWHRIGRIELGESSVIVVVGAPHRPEAFAAGQYAIDAIKATAPIWKHEAWEDGADWGTGAHAPVDAVDVPSPALVSSSGAAAVPSPAPASPVSASPASASAASPVPPVSASPASTTSASAASPVASASPVRTSSGSASAASPASTTSASAASPVASASAASVAASSAVSGAKASH